MKCENNWLVGEIECFRLALLRHFQLDTEANRQVIKKAEEFARQLRKMAPVSNVKPEKQTSSSTKSGYCANPQCDTVYLSTPLKICSRCKKAQYCDVACQKQHWQEHKKCCNAAQ